MQSESATVVIVGAGAMGCLFAARLVESGVKATLIDVDAPRIEALASLGVTIEDDHGTRTVPVRACLAAQATETADFVILFTKGMHSAAAIRSVAHLARPQTYAMTLQNGLGNADAISEVFAMDKILIGVTDFPADLVAATKVSSHGTGHIWLGSLNPADSSGAEAAVKLFMSAGLDAVVDPQVEIQIWEKAAFNAALNSLATVTCLTVGGMDAAPGRRIIEAIVGEVVATAKARGLGLDRRRIESKISHALANHRLHKASMLQDRLAGRPTEIETINGAVVRAAAEVGVATPVTAALADLVRLLERPGATRQ